MSASQSRLDIDPATATLSSTVCAWAVNPDLTTLFASPAFARLVGINRLVLADLPWFVLLPTTSLPALEWLVDTHLDRPTTVLEVRHLEGWRIPVAARRVYGGPTQNKAVFALIPLSRLTITRCAS